MEQSFYHFMMSFRDKTPPDEESRLADWMFHDIGFPKHAKDYHEISNYLEMNSPFEGALSVFDELYDSYLIKINQYF